MLPSSLRYTIETSWLIANKNSSLVSSWKFTILPFVDRVTYHVKSTRFVFTGKRKLPIFHGNGVMARPDSKKFVRGNLCSLRYLRRTKRGRWKILDASPIVFRPFSFFFFLSSRTIRTGCKSGRVVDKRAPCSYHRRCLVLAELLLERLFVG